MCVCVCVYVCVCGLYKELCLCVFNNLFFNC